MSMGLSAGAPPVAAKEVKSWKLPAMMTVAGALAGLLIVLGVAGLMLPQVLLGANRVAGREFAVVVAAYAGVLSAMTVFAVGTTAIATAIGGVLFLVSDTLIARERFVRPVPQGRLLVIATYHAAQFLIVLGLVRSW